MCSAPILFSSSCSPLFNCNSLHSPPNRHARRERLSHRGRGGHLAKEEREGEPDDSSSSSSERLANEVGRQPTFLFRKKPRFSPSQRFFLPLESSAQTLSFKMSPLMVPDFRLLTTIGEWVAVGWLEGEGGERVFFSSSHSKTSCSRGVGKSWRSFFPFAFSLSQFSPFLHQLSLRISLLRRRPLFCSPTSPLPHRNANVEKTQTKTKNTPKKQTLSRPKKKKTEPPRPTTGAAPSASATWSNVLAASAKPGDLDSWPAVVSGGVETTFQNLHEMFRKSVQVHGERPCLGSREVLANEEVRARRFFLVFFFRSFTFYFFFKKKLETTKSKSHPLSFSPSPSRPRTLLFFLP